MTLEQMYAAIGGDYKGVMERLPSADFVRRFALKFLQDDSFPNLKKALEAQDAPTAFRAAHTLKGVCQNLGFDALYAPASALTEALRGGTLEGDQITVYAPDEITLSRLDNDRVRGVLSAEAEKVSGQPVRLLLRVGEAPSASPEENLKSLLEFGSQFDNIQIK